MDAITSVRNNYNVSCKARALKFHQNVPQEIRTMVTENPAVQRFINADKPNTLVQQFLNLFRKSKKLNVVYDNHYYSSRLGITENQGEKLSFLFDGKKKVFESTNTRIGINRTNTPSLQEQLTNMRDLEAELR